jgi:hypothetical protein
MTPRRKHLHPFDDVEIPHPTVADHAAGGIPTEPVSARLGDLWSDFLRVPHDPDAAAPARPASAVPLLDDMKGILQWD